MEGRAAGAIAVVALLVLGLGAWSALRWDELKIVDAAADLSPDGSTGDLGLGLQTTTTVAGTVTTVPQTTPSSVPVPDCAIGDEEASGDPATDWATIVVDARLALPSDFAPPDLVDAEAAGFDTGDQIREIIVDDLDALRQAAEDNGTPLGLVSAYRSYSYQKGLYDRAVAREGEAEAQKETARPGHSEHQLGTSVDLLAGASQSLEPSFAETETGRWLGVNAPTYGFIISYPDMPPTRTCYGFEPWHLRYVGRDLAPEITASELAPREWMLSHPEAP